MPHRTLVAVPPPPWAKPLLAWACTRYLVAVPALKWNANPSSTPGFAGRAYTKQGCLMVVACADFDYDASSLLHEVAHHISFLKGSGAGHSIAFYLIVWDLIFAQNLLLDKIILLEVAYKATAWPALLQFGHTPSPLLQEMANLAASHRTLRNAEKEVDRLAARLHSRSSLPETDPSYVAWRNALGRWWRLDRALNSPASA
jgi:hypothetical protein